MDTEELKEMKSKDANILEECALAFYKTDAGKPRLDLVPPLAIEAIGQVMTQALTKYEENSWKKVERYRYRAALMRHVCKYLENPNGVDEESGYPHIWHITTNASFLCELEARRGSKEG